MKGVPRGNPRGYTKMKQTLTRAEELQNDIDNITFSIRYFKGVLAELEQLGKTHTQKYKVCERNIEILKYNKKRLEEKLENIEAEWIDNKMTELGW